MPASIIPPENPPRRRLYPVKPGALRRWSREREAARLLASIPKTRLELLEEREEQQYEENQEKRAEKLKLDALYYYRVEEKGISRFNPSSKPEVGKS